jgi:hypothetical protein
MMSTSFRWEGASYLCHPRKAQNPIRRPPPPFAPLHPSRPIIQRRKTVICFSRIAGVLNPVEATD